MKKFLLVLLLVILIPFKVNAQSNYFEIKIGAPVDKTELSSTSNFYLVDENFNKIHDLGVNKLNVSLKNGKVSLTSKDNIISNNFPIKGEFKLASDNLIKLKNTYRGFFHFEVENNKLNIINTVELEDYIKGVVNNELDESHPMESLKAQAVTSRTFALANKNKYLKKGYNLTDDTSSQVYRGQSSESEKTNKAVTETNGYYVAINNKPISAIFGASSGGMTASAKEVWGGDYPYLTILNDPYSSDYKWSLKFSESEFINKLKNKYPLEQISAIRITEKDNSGRAKEIEISGDKVYNIKASELRNILGNTKMKSTLFDIDMSNGIVFNGKGYGHGVGLSQYGAANMAKDGKNYEEILKFYFPGTELIK